MVLLASGLSGCKQEVLLTRAPALGPAPAAVQPVRRELTVMQLALPIDLQAATETAEAALPQSLGRVIDWLDDAACARRTRWLECTGAKIEGEVERNGEVSLTITEGRLELSVPLKYSLSARGLGWARDLRDQKTGELVAKVPIEVVVASDFETAVRFKDGIVLSERTVQILQKGKFALSKTIDARLKKPLAPVLESIREGVGAKGFKETAEKAWRALHTPIELSREPQLWLRVEPERITGGGFVVDEGKPLFRLQIASRISVATGQRPAPPLTRLMPALTKPAAGETIASDGRSTLRLPIVMGWEPMLEAVRTSFPKREVVKSALSRDATQLAGQVRTVSFYAARNQLGIEMQLEIKEPARWAGQIGTAHFVGQPIVRNGILEMETVELPGQRSVFAPQPKGAPRTVEGQNAPRIGIEPFGARIQRAARMDLGPALRDILPHANSLIEQPLGEGFSLGGRFDEVVITGVEPVRDGFEVAFSLGGQLLLRYDPAIASAAPAQPIPSATR